MIAPPIVRPIIDKFTGVPEEDHFIVYSTVGQYPEKLISAFSQFPRHKFHIYGFGNPNDTANCIFKPCSTEGFLDDLARSRGVIATAGFSLISECLYLKKKMLLLPVRAQYEQQINAHYMEKLGLGINTNTLDESSLSRFFDILDAPVPDDSRILWPDNEQFFRIFQQQLNKLPQPINIELT